MSYLKRRKYQRYLAPRVSHVHLETSGLLCESTVFAPVVVDEIDNETGEDPAGSYFDNF